MRLLQNGIATAMAVLNEIRQFPLRSPGRYQSELEIVQKMFPEIRRALMYLANTGTEEPIKKPVDTA